MTQFKYESTASRTHRMARRIAFRPQAGRGAVATTTTATDAFATASTAGHRDHHWTASPMTLMSPQGESLAASAVPAASRER